MSHFEPYISRETIEYHYGKYHAGYVNKLNALIGGIKYADKSLVSIILSADGAIFSNAAQVFNHDYYFNGLSSMATMPSKALSKAIINIFGSMNDIH